MTEDDLATKDPEERRRRMLAAARDLIVAKGFAGTRIADIAELAGTSPALVVYHYGSLDGVLSEAVASIEDRFFLRFRDEVGSGDAVEQLRLFGELAADVGDAVTDWVMWMEIWVRALRDEKVNATRSVWDAQVRDQLRAIIDAGVAEGTFTCPDPGASATRLAALMDGLAVQLSLHDPSVTEERMVALWMQGAALEVGIPASRLGS